MLFDHGEFGFIRYHAKVEPFKIVVRDMGHVVIVEAVARSSQEKFLFSLMPLRVPRSGPPVYADSSPHERPCIQGCFAQA